MTNNISEILATIAGALGDKNPAELQRLVESVTDPAVKGAIWQAVKAHTADDLVALCSNGGGGDPRFTIRTAKDALTPRPPVEYIVDPLIRPATVSMIVGDSGTKKTYIGLSLAVKRALGQDFLGFQTKAGRCLYVDEETSEAYLLDRLAEIIRGAYADESVAVDVISGAGFNLRNLDDLTILEAIVAGGEYSLVILDAMSDFMPGADQNTAQDMTPFFLALRKIAKDTGAAFVLIHHTNRQQQYRGSTDIKSKVDLMLMVESDQESGTIRFKTEKARHVRPMSFAATATWRDGCFWLEKSDAESPVFLTKGEDYVIRYLTQNGAKTRKAIMLSADSCTERQAGDAIYALVKKGLIYRTNPGEIGKAVEAIYDLKAIKND